MNRDHSVISETASKFCISDSFVDYDGYSIILLHLYSVGQGHFKGNMSQNEHSIFLPNLLFFIGNLREWHHYSAWDRNLEVTLGISSPSPSKSRSSLSHIGAILYTFDSMHFSPFSAWSLLSRTLSCQDMFRCLLTGTCLGLYHTQFNLLAVYSPTLPTVLFFFF